MEMIENSRQDSHQKENRPVYINKLALLYQQPVDPVL